MRIPKNDSAGLIIDIQEKLFPHIHEHDKLERNATILINGLEVLGLPVLVTEQYTRGLGFTIPSVSAALSGISRIEKTAFSCCDDENFRGKLTETGKKYIIMAGIETHVCVLQTAIDLKEMGFQPVVVADCVASRKPEDKTIALDRLRQEGVLVTSYESVLFELARVSGTPEFKEISRLVK